MGVNDDETASHISYATYMATPSSHYISSRSEWILDSGSTIHICNNRDAFSWFVSKNDAIASLLNCKLKDTSKQTITLCNVKSCGLAPMRESILSLKVD